MIRKLALLAALILATIALPAGRAGAWPGVAYQIPLYNGNCHGYFHFKSSIPRASQWVQVSPWGTCKRVSVATYATDGYWGPVQTKTNTHPGDTVTSWIGYHPLCYAWVVIVNDLYQLKSVNVLYPSMAVR